MLTQATSSTPCRANSKYALVLNTQWKLNTHCLSVVLTREYDFTLLCSGGYTDHHVYALQRRFIAKMADNIEQKLNMSLDELAKKERTDDRSSFKQRRGGCNQHQGRNGAERRAGQQRPSKQQQPAAFYPQPMPYGNQQFPNWGPDGPVQQGWMQGGMMPLQQQAWQAVHDRQGGYARPSVFTRLSAPQQYPQHRQQRAGPPGQRQQQQPAPQQPAPPPKPDLHCRLDKQTGMVIIQHSGTDIIQVRWKVPE